MVEPPSRKLQPPYWAAQMQGKNLVLFKKDSLGSHLQILLEDAAGTSHSL